MAGANESPALSSRPDRATLPNPYEVATVDLSHDGGYGWRVVSDCGVVKVYNGRGECLCG